MEYKDFDVNAVHAGKVEVKRKFSKRKRDKFVRGKIVAVYPLTGIELKNSNGSYKWMAWTHIENITIIY